MVLHNNRRDRWKWTDPLSIQLEEVAELHTDAQVAADTRVAAVERSAGVAARSHIHSGEAVLVTEVAYTVGFHTEREVARRMVVGAEAEGASPAIPQRSRSQYSSDDWRSCLLGVVAGGKLAEALELEQVVEVVDAHKSQPTCPQQLCQRDQGRFPHCWE